MLEPDAGGVGVQIGDRAGVGFGSVDLMGNSQGGVIGCALAALRAGVRQASGRLHTRSAGSQRAAMRMRWSRALGVIGPTGDWRKALSREQQRQQRGRDGRRADHSRGGNDAR